MSSLFGIGGGGNVGAAVGFYSYSIDQSLRFNDNDSAKLTRTPSSASNRATWTWSGWIKRGNLGTKQTFFCSTAGDYNLHFATDNKLKFEGAYGTTATDAVFRDVSSFYHILAIHDTTEGTSSDRFKIYVNGVQQTTSGSYPSGDGVINNTVQHGIGGQASGNFFDGYLAEVNFIDGTALDATSFGETIGGIWVPKQYSGSYGTNGFYLSFADSSAIGDDLSGNTNDFTANNLAASDVMSGESPTNNFATLNPLAEDNKNIKSGAVLSEGNLVTAAAGFGSGTSWGGGQSTISIPTDKKIYCEMLCSNATGSSWFGGVSIPELSANSTGVSNTGQISVYNRSAMINGVETDYGASAGLGGLGVSKLASGDILQIAVDGATGKVWFGRNGTYFKSPSTDNSGTTGDPAAGTHEIGTVTNSDGKPLFIIVGGSSATVHVNFGQDSSFAGQKTSGSAGAQDANGIGDFYYTPPTDYVCLAASSLSEPAIGPNSTEQADDYFNTVLYTGNGSTQSITGAGFQPDWTWLKSRSNAQGHNVFDSIRGANKALFPNDANAEFTDTDRLTSFDSDGFSLGADANVNTNSATYVSWNWKAGGTAVSNTDGSITSQVSAAPDAGFSIVSYTGTGANATVGHGLSSAPEMLIIKNRDSSLNWPVGHKDISGGFGGYIQLDLTNSQTTGVGVIFNSTAPTSSVFSIGSNNQVNNSGDDHIAYCFHSVPGYQAVGSYVGNGSTDGTFVYTGFKVSFLLWKNASAGSTQWIIFDAVRNTYNYADLQLRPNDSTAEIDGGASYGIDLLSNGFKIRSSDSNFNGSGNTIIYLAIGDSFKYSNAK